MMESKSCKKCGNVFELTTEYWHKRKRSKDGFTPRCKTCTNEESRLRKLGLIGSKKKAYLEKEEITKGAETEIFKEGIYKVRRTRENLGKGGHKTKQFKGKMIYQDRRLLTLRNEKGITETFLKMDFITGDYEILEA